MSRQRRIPANHAAPYAAWSLPAIAATRVIRVQDSDVRSRRSQGEGAVVLEAREFVSRPEARAVQRRPEDSPGSIDAEELWEIIAAATEEGRREGFAAGHAEGFAQGERDGNTEGLARGRHQVEEIVGRFSTLIETLQAPLQGQEQALRDALLTAVLQITRAVLRVETRLQPGHIAQVIDEALAALPSGARGVRVYVSRVDRELLEDFGEGEAVPALLVDPALEAGDCRIESEDSLVDFTQSARLAVIAEQLLAHAEGGMDPS